jgi:integrase
MTRKKTSVSVTEFLLRGKKVFRLRYRIETKVKRLFFETWDEAQAAKISVLEQLESRGTESFSGVQGGSVSSAFEDYSRSRHPKMRGNHLRLSKWWNEKFIGKYGSSPVRGIGPRNIDAFLENGGWSGTTKAQGYVYLRMVFNWLVRYGHVEKSPVLLADVPVKSGRHHLLTIAEVGKLLTFTESKTRLRAWLALGLFAGMRQSEVGRAAPDHLREQEIFVPITKSTEEIPRPRYVPIQPVLLRFLPDQWDCLDEWHIKRMRSNLCVQMGWKKWPKNCLRHTAASMHLAMWQDAGKTAFFLGHSSPQMVNKTYARAVPQSEAIKFWNL